MKVIALTIMGHEYLFVDTMTDIQRQELQPLADRMVYDGKPDEPSKRDMFVKMVSSELDIELQPVSRSQVIRIR